MAKNKKKLEESKNRIKKIKIKMKIKSTAMYSKKIISFTKL